MSPNFGRKFGLTAKAPGQSPAKWYKISNVSLDSADIYIYEEIGFWGVSAQDFIRDMLSLETDVINLHLNSPGGEVYDGIAIHGALKSHPATVNVFVDALAASAASFIAMAGDTVSIMRNAQMMIHRGQGFAMGDGDTMRQLADRLDKIDANIADMYLAKAGGKLENWVAAMAAETWYSAEEAKAAGLADTVIDSWEMSPDGVAPGEDPASYDPEMAWKDRIRSMRTRYAGRSVAPEPYIPATQENSTVGNAPLTPPAEPAEAPKPVVDTIDMPDELDLAVAMGQLMSLKGGK